MVNHEKILYERCSVGIGAWLLVLVIEVVARSKDRATTRKMDIGAFYEYQFCGELMQLGAS